MRTRKLELLKIFPLLLCGIFRPVFGQADLVDGDLIQFNSNGGWCWYQDERVIVDTDNATLLVASLANRYGVGGTLKDGDVDVAHFTLANRISNPVTLKNALLSYGGGDDHNVAALLLRPSGGYIAMYAGHNNDYISFYRTYNTQSGTWGNESQFNWNTMPGGTDFETTYSNLHYLSQEGRMYNFARTDDRSPNFMVSDNEGASWSYGGQLTRPDVSIGYVNGYFKYASNGVDRIDFVATEFHPRDYNTSIYHGYVQGGRSFNSAGTEIDSDISDKTAPLPADFTQVFAANTNVQGVQMTRCWNIDLQNYSDGSVATVFKCRANNSDTDHRFMYARLAGGQWTTSYLARAGAKLFSSEEDYTGLIALDPNDPWTMYISTPIDPATDASLGNHEIFKGTTSNNGATWSWTTITSQSSRDNYRPVVPDWNGQNTALVWFRGSMTRSQNYNGAMVGLIYSNETANPKTYVDASTGNTTLSNGSAFSSTGPSSGMGSADDQWHERTGFGNGGSIYTSAESGGENAPVLRTRVSSVSAGTYDVWVNFWANPTSDWRIEAGLSSGNMHIYRSMASEQVEAGEHATSLTLSGTGSTFLYQAYLGRVQISANGNIDVFIDDEAIQTGTTTSVGDVSRTWYDGISYALVGTQVGIANSGESFSSFGVRDSDFGTKATVTFSVTRAGPVELKAYNTLGKEMRTLVNRDMTPGEHRVEWNPENLTPGLYFIQIKADGNSQAAKWVLK